MLNISVRNFRGIRNADLACARIALACGRNEQGKSSIVDAVRATLLGDPQPYGLTKDELPTKLIFKGADKALVSVSITDEGRETAMNWPSADVESTGAPFRSTPVAAGASRFTAMPPRDKAKTLAEYLKTAPSEAEFLEACKESGLSKTELDVVWKDVQQQGWDGAWTKHKSEGTKLKGAWEQITAASYGVKVGANWRPKGWGPDHEAMTDEEIAAWRKEATAALEGAIGTVAINEGEKKRLESLTLQIPKLRELLKTREQDGKQAKATLEQAERDLQAIPVLEPDNWPCCPHCKKPVAVRAGKNGQSVLEIPKKSLDEKERKKLADQTEDAQRVFNGAREKYDAARNTYDVCNKDLKAAEDAKAQLENSNPDAAKVDIDALRADVKAVDGIAAAKTKIRDALKKHMEVVARLDVVAVLAPDGLRSDKLKVKLAKFNEKLGELCEIAGWAAVELTEDLDVELNGYRYAMCATSGQMRCDVTLQVAFAMIDQSEVILVDDADQLDAKGRNGLFALLDHSERYCLVGLMLTKTGQAPELSSLNLGQTYWIEDAESKLLSEVRKAT